MKKTLVALTIVLAVASTIASADIHKKNHDGSCPADHKLNKARTLCIDDLTSEKYAAKPNESSRTQAPMNNN